MESGVAITWIVFIVLMAAAITGVVNYFIPTANKAKCMKIIMLAFWGVIVVIGAILFILASFDK